MNTIQTEKELEQYVVQELSGKFPDINCKVKLEFYPPNDKFITCRFYLYTDKNLTEEQVLKLIERMNSQVGKGEHLYKNGIHHIIHTNEDELYEFFNTKYIRIKFEKILGKILEQYYKEKL